VSPSLWFCAGIGALADCVMCRSSDLQEAPSQLHDISGVKISNTEAARLDSESTTYLLERNKLALVVDLDQTIIHATVDPTVGEWMKDAKNPNYTALQDVVKFRLATDGRAILDDGDDKANGDSKKNGETKPQHQEGCWYYVKPRPGLQDFLTYLSKRYEMYVYTMGTRSYAESVCRLVDPQGIYFGARILSRDENGSLLQKSLKKLFPMDTSMVVIIDDRADVWRWSPNLIKVVPFEFFVGTGDINASFLPAAPTVPTPTTAGNGEDGATSAGEKTENGDGQQKGEDEKEEAVKKDEAEANAVAEESQKSAISEQLESRPLAKMQEALDVKKDQQTSEERMQVGEVLLRDHDRELTRLKAVSLFRKDKVRVK
jgi:RNA polymerase II subunit A-like phosphatase